MKIAFFSFKPYEKQFFDIANESAQHEIVYHCAHLTTETAVLAKGFPAICCFVSDTLDAKVLTQLVEFGVKLVALRSAGYNHVDLACAKKLGLKIVRVPAYSPYAVAEHAVGLILALNRKIHRAYNRVREHDFSLHGLMGFDLHQTTVGIIGTGNIGKVFARIMQGFGCHLLAYDPLVNPECTKLGVDYVELSELYQRADIISLHCPLTPDTFHMINAQALQQMKPGVMIINTSRGAVIDTTAVIKALKSQHIGYLGLDVYEEEDDLFFEDLSDKVIQDDVFARLQTFPNVIITGHQGFFTKQALQNIALITIKNLDAFCNGKLENEVVAK